MHTLDSEIPTVDVDEELSDIRGETEINRKYLY